MPGQYEDIHDWFDELKDEHKLLFWKFFAIYLNDNELKLCMKEIRKGKRDLCEILYKNGFIDKYQIYFYQVMRKINDMEEDYGRGD